MTNIKSDETKGPNISRRNFLKVGAAAAGGGLLSTVAGMDAYAASGKPLHSDYVDKEVDSCCQFCQVRCTTKVQVKDGRVVNVYGNPDNFWTGGSMCPKGKSMVELTYSPHRIVHPLLKDGSGWRRISYERAVDMVAQKILKLKDDFPEDFTHRMALFMPLWESRESEIAALMALRMAGFSDYCSPGDACIASSATALSLCLGSGISPSILNEVTKAETLVLFGANISEMYPPYMRWINLAREKGVKIIYLDPRITPTSNFCDEQLMPRPGTDGALVLGVIRHLLQNNLYDKGFTASHINGFEDLFKASEVYTPGRVSEITWIPEEQVVSFAERLGKSNRTMIWMGGSLSRNTNAIQTIRMIIALQAITNNLSGTGKGLMNVQGGKPGGEEEFLEHYSAEDLGTRMKFRKILYSMGKNKLNLLLLNSSYRRYPDANRVKEAISKVDFVVHRGFFMNEEAQLADLIIPGTMVYESEGSQYGAQRQVVWRNKAIERPGETVEDWRFYVDLGKKINRGTFPEVNSAEEIYELFRHTVHSWKGITLERLKESNTGITWPCYSEDEDNRDTLYPDNNFLTADGKVSLQNKALGAIKWKEPKGSPTGEKIKEADKAFPLIFMQGKVVQHWQHTYTNWSSYVDKFSEGNFVQINPKTADDLGINDGDQVFIETKIGKLKAKAKVINTILPGVVFTPSHPAPTSPFSGNNGGTINTIIPGYWDKVSAQFNGFGCRLIKV